MYDFLAVAGCRFALVFVRGIHIRRASRKFGGAGVDTLVDRPDTQLMTKFAQFRFRGIEQDSQAAITQAAALPLTDRIAVHIGLGFLFDRVTSSAGFLALCLEPGIDSDQG